MELDCLLIKGTGHTLLGLQFRAQHPHYSTRRILCTPATPTPRRDGDRRMAGSCWLPASKRKWGSLFQGETLPQRNRQKAEGDTHILLCGFTDAHKHAALTHVDIHTEIKSRVAKAQFIVEWPDFLSSFVSFLYAGPWCLKCACLQFLDPLSEVDIYVDIYEYAVFLFVSRNIFQKF